MVKRRIAIITLLLCLCMMPCRAWAASTTDAKEPISTPKACALTIFYGYDGTVFADQQVKLYKVAEVSADFQYTLTADFATSKLALNGIQSNSEWDTIRSTLEAHIVANSIAPLVVATTDADGKASFPMLMPGLYLASAVQVAQGELRCTFASVLVALPGLKEDGLWQYDISVAAKPAILPPAQESMEMKVLKLWKGDEGRVDRPLSVQVEIFRNGASYETITLSESNNWVYTWSAPDDGAAWNVVERNVPAGYTATVTQRDTAFVLTNTRGSDAPGNPPPATGDTGNVMLYVVLMFVSGGMMIILGMIWKRNRYEETN